MPYAPSLAFVLALLLSPTTLGAPLHVAESVDVPAAHQPANFTGAVGERFTVKLVVPPTVPPGRSFTLTVRVSAPGRWWHRPNRPDLRDLPRFARRFDISLPAPPRPPTSAERIKGFTPDLRNQPDREWPDQGVWEFDYLLKLKKDAVARVPPLLVPYFTPNPSPNLPGYFNTAVGREVPLVVRELTPVETVAAAPIDVPERFWHVAEGPAVLERPGWPLPSMAWLVVLLVVPPLAALACYLAGRWLSPNAAQLARKRHSRAARQALGALAALGPTTKDGLVGQVVGIVTRYLRDRTGLAAVSPTPGDVGTHLQRVGLPPDLASKAAEFLRACDAARYGPPGSGSRVDLAGVARQLIDTLEAESWSAAS